MLSVLTCVVDNCSSLMIRNMMALSESSLDFLKVHIQSPEVCCLLCILTRFISFRIL